MYPIFDKTTKNLPLKPLKHNLSSEEQYLSPDEDDETSSWVWYDPPEDSAPVKFCMDTSLHGLQYLGERNRHICERLFWLTAFTAAVASAVALIWHMCQAYVNMPIITVFNPSEVTLDTIPFPSVTICNVNNIQKSKLNELTLKAVEAITGNQSSEYELLPILATFLDIHHICQSARTFTERFVPIPKFGHGIHEIMMNRSDELKPFLNPKDTLHKYSQSCKDMILFCVWNDAIQNCSELFQEVETDYGYCCTFNMMPAPLLFQEGKREISGKFENSVLEEWRMANLTTDNLVSDVNRTYPYKQLYPGRSAGLSVLLEPDLDEVYCTNSDSEGFMVEVNTPLDYPRIKDSGIAVQTDSEVFIGLNPEITMSDESTTQFPLEKRKCYYSTEKKLPTYSTYTTSNCLDECVAYRVREKCNCLRYYMPGYGSDNQTLCEPGQYPCTEHVREEVIRQGLAKSCYGCLPSCSEIVYNTDTSYLKIRESYTARLFKHFPEHARAQNVSIVHVYFNVDSTYPRLRKEMSTIIDLISSAGGLLGLCMGFSMLSLLEIIYHSTIRLFWNYYRERSKEQNKEQRKRETNGNSDYIGDHNPHNVSYSKSNKLSYGFMGKVFQQASVKKMVKGHVRRNSDASQVFQTSRGKSDIPDYYQTTFN